jgi:hypothetical protein
MMQAYVDSLRHEDCPIPMGLEVDKDVHVPLINVALGVGFISVASGVTALACLVAGIQYFRQKPWRWSAKYDDDGTSSGSDNAIFSPPEKYRTALCFARTTPWAIQGAVPLMCVVTMFLLIGSNCLYFALSVINFELGTEGTSVYEIMPYNIFYSIKMLHEHGFNKLAFVIFLFSGVLPYGKLFAMLSMWLLPNSVVSRGCRGRVLYFVDQIGKYSLVDIFVIQFINGTLYAYILLPHQDDGGAPISIAIRTKEMEGFFAYVMATVASLIIGHVCLYYHEKDPKVKSDQHKKLAEEADMATILTSGQLTDVDKVRDVERVLTGHDRWWIGPFLVAVLVALMLSYVLPAFTVTVSAAGVVLNKTTYSLIEFVSSMPSFQLHVRFGTIFGMITFIVFALSTSVLHVIVLLGIWYCEVKPQWLAIVRTVAHTLFAWAALDVTFISMVLTLVEMSSSDFHHLNSIGRTFASKLLGKPVIDPKGVRLEVKLDYATWIILAAILAHYFIGRMVMAMVERAEVAHEDQCADGDLDSIKDRVRSFDLCENPISGYENMQLVNGKGQTSSVPLQWPQQFPVVSTSTYPLSRGTYAPMPTVPRTYSQRSSQSGSGNYQVPVPGSRPIVPAGFAV